MKRNSLLIPGLVGPALLAGLMTATAQTNGPVDYSKVFKNDKEKNSYAVGVFEGSRLKPFLDEQSNELDVAVVKQAFAEELNGTAKIDLHQERDILMAFEAQVRAKIVAKEQALAKAGADFLEKNKNQPGVITLTNGLQYKVLTMGTGEKPKADDTVTVNYRGTHIDGTEFDSSYKHGQPLERQANQLIPGWTQALQMMPVGSKWQLFIPPGLGYGDRGSGAQIGPGETLIFEVELLAKRPTPPAAPPAQMTSDIIKVPSAEGLKHGEKIETIKASDVGKMTTQTNN
jgi:FKBP-type peptidyl-prolyl cis-trans isomerase FklB